MKNLFDVFNSVLKKHKVLLDRIEYDIPNNKLTSISKFESQILPKSVKNYDSIAEFLMVEFKEFVGENADRLGNRDRIILDLTVGFETNINDILFELDFDNYILEHRLDLFTNKIGNNLLDIKELTNLNVENYFFTIKYNKRLKKYFIDSKKVVKNNGQEVTNQYTIYLIENSHIPQEILESLYLSEPNKTYHIKFDTTLNEYILV